MSTKYQIDFRGALIKRSIFDGVVFAYLLTVLLCVIFRPTEEMLLNLSQNSLFILAFFIFSLFLSYFLNKSGIKTLGEKIFQPPHKKAEELPKAWYKSFSGVQLIVLFFVTLILGINQTNFSLVELLDRDGLAGAGRLFGGLTSPDFAILPEAVLAIIETIFIAFMATILAIPLAFVLSFLCAKNLMGGSKFSFAVYSFLRTILNITRSVEALIWAIIFSVWVGIGPYAGMLALMLHSVAALAKQYSEIVECIEEGPVEGVQSTGASSLQTVWFSVVPQIVLPYISFTIYRWDINVRMATIIGLVGGGGIGTLLIRYQGAGLWQQVGCIVVVIAVAVWLMDTASAYIREAIK